MVTAATVSTEVKPDETFEAAIAILVGMGLLPLWLELAEGDEGCGGGWEVEGGRLCFCCMENS